MDISIFAAIAICVIALFAGFESVLDSFQLHQPIIVCTLIGLATGNLTEGLLLGGQLQLIALGWMNIGAAQAPDAALAGVIAGILVLTKGASVSEGIAIAVPLAIAGQVLTIFVRTMTVGLAHYADAQAEKGSIRGVESANMMALGLQGLRVMIPAIATLALPASAVLVALAVRPVMITDGLAGVVGLFVPVGHVLVIKMRSTNATRPSSFIRFVLAVVTELNLVVMAITGL